MRSIVLTKRLTWSILLALSVGCASGNRVGHETPPDFRSHPSNVSPSPGTHPVPRHGQTSLYDPIPLHDRGRPDTNTHSPNPATHVVSYQQPVTPLQQETEPTEPRPATDPQSLPDPSSSPQEVPPLEVVPAGDPASSLKLDQVIRSVYQSYPLLDSALESREIAFGQHLSAHGNFDLKLKGASENGPLGFYKTYRQSVGLVQALYTGGEVFGGYRVGRGQFQPWYLERQTNDGGEFKAGVAIPLIKNRTIDERRAELWRTNLGRQVAEFDIQAQLIGFVQEASYAYWEWVAAGRAYNVFARVLELAEERVNRIQRLVDTGLIDPPELTDNQRLIAERRAKLAEARRKVEQKAAKLSLYLRDARGNPIVPTIEQLPNFPNPILFDGEQLQSDVQTAWINRPDLQFLDVVGRQLEVDRAEATNELLPEVSALIVGSKDMGEPTSSKGDKTPFELEAGVFVDVPLQRSKARGKLTAIEAKMRQLAAKRRMTQDKISVDVQNAYAALLAAYEQVMQTREAVRLAEDLAQRERVNFEAGASDVLKITLREQYAAESALKELDALTIYHQAAADYQAALADLPEWESLPIPDSPEPRP